MNNRLRCARCNTYDNVQPYAFDIDLPTVWLCQFCLYVILSGRTESSGSGPTHFGEFLESEIADE
jgi:late competence protein required for DNA uptake (superfamily II DNA/RNA helicase)